MSERITIDKKEFESFIAENQTLVERSQVLLKKIDTLENVNKKLNDELRVSREKFESLEASLNINMHKTDETLRKARENIARLLSETGKRISD